ncbi:hypothetical protein SAMN06272735_0302 [Streptomyces sp. TLI_55]|uniref:hypothetical protein n=1 Tax=Streptomyces sp. TLI_55 TaxID=1938861 RepID=UPI000BD393B4|nr:hypothetical protein [Streptomyces sp. TLI_55]SNX55868.1 hypothetical protein SAMN06272735_0302 [Streptomyces sp. TLI_55]
MRPRESSCANSGYGTRMAGTPSTATVDGGACCGLVSVGSGKVLDGLDTVAYAELCERFNGGVFLHQVPKVDMKDDGSVMKAAHIVGADGWEVDLPLWADAAECERHAPRVTTHTDRAIVRAPAGLWRDGRSPRVTFRRSCPPPGPGLRTRRRGLKATWSVAAWVTLAPGWPDMQLLDRRHAFMWPTT